MGAPLIPGKKNHNEQDLTQLGRWSELTRTAVQKGTWQSLRFQQTNAASWKKRRCRELGIS